MRRQCRGIASAARSAQPAMSAPTNLRGIGRMNESELLCAARAATDRSGLVRLLELLGIAGRFTPAPRYPLPFCARIKECARGSLLTSMVELQQSSDAYVCKHVTHVLSTA